MTSGTTGPILLKRAGCPGRTTAPTGGGSSSYKASPLGGAACCGALWWCFLVADAASGGVRRLRGGRRGPTAFTGGRQAMQLRAGRALHIGSARAGSASSRRTDKSRRESSQDYSWRFRRAGLVSSPRAPYVAAGPPPTSPRTVTEPPRRRRGGDAIPTTTKNKNVQRKLYGARGPWGWGEFRPCACTHSLRPSRPPR